MSNDKRFKTPVKPNKDYFQALLYEAIRFQELNPGISPKESFLLGRESIEDLKDKATKQLGLFV